MSAVFAKFPAWLFYAALAVLFWGAWGLQSKVLVGRTSPFTGQVLFTLGLIVPVAIVLQSKWRFHGKDVKRGLSYAVLTGLLGGAGNVAFYMALVDGQTSLVAPMTSLYPVVTVLLASCILKERLSRPQFAGVGLALVSIYLLSV